MLDYGDIRDLYKNVDRVNSTHLVIGEWNMNKYQEILEYGIYKNPGLATRADQRTFTPNSSYNTLDGNNYFIYDDRTVKLSPESQFFSDLSSIFLPNRPDPGIVLLQHYKNNLITRNSTSIRSDNINPNTPRYYPFSYSREYDYFNSAKVMAADDDARGVSNAYYNISCANPYVVYAEEFPINKITVKIQNHVALPSSFQIEYLEGSTWKVAFPSASSGASLFSDGVLEVYLSNSQWSASVSRLTDITELTNPSSTNVKTVKGIRFITYKMNRISYGLEIIELSPRLEMDITQYTESFSFNSSMGDTTSMGLPVGSIVSSTGDLSLSNEENQFLFSSTLNDLKMLNPDTKFTFYQIVNTESSSAIFPLKVMYSNQWNVGEDYSVSVDIEDGFKYLRERSAPDLMLQYKTGTKLSTAILTVLDNAGITGMEFEQSGLGLSNTGEDVSIRNFFCKKEQTVAEVLEQLALATQCSMFYDAVGKLKVMTKERLIEKVKIEASSSLDLKYNPNPDPTKFVWYNGDWYFYNGNTDALPYETEWNYDEEYGFYVSEDFPPPSQDENDIFDKTDFWFIFNEDYTKTAGGNANEYAYINDYTSNVISYSEQKVNPLTDGEISYHTYGPRKVPGINNLPENVLNDLLEDIPASALAFSNFTYATTILWTPGNDNSAVLGAANLVLNLTSNRLKDVFTQNYTALNEEEAIRFIYQTTNSLDYFPGQYQLSQAKQSLVIFIDRNEGYTFPDYEGYVLIDKEYIKYKGKLFAINGRLKILFSEEEFQQELRYLPKGGSISIIGLIVDVKLKVVSQGDAQYTYQVVGDGRGRFSTDVETHYALAENSDGINVNKTFKLSLGETQKFAVPGNITATTKFNFLDRGRYKSVKESLGTLAFNDLQSYLGFLKLSGPKSPQEDIDIIEQLDKSGPTEDITKKLKDMNRQVDNAVDGNFDPYIYMSGERNIYGQYIDLDFVPNSISTRMRLFSTQKKRRGNQYIMSTNSSIAGIGFGLNDKNEGYYVEVESIGAGKDSVAAKAARNNLRMYKVQINPSTNKYEPTLLFTAPVGAQTVSNTEVQVIKNVNTADPVFELEIRIKQATNGVKYTVYYGNRKVNSFSEERGPAFGINSKRIFMFVRNDSQAIYEYIAAAARPAGKDNDAYFKSANFLDQKIQSGILPVSKDFYFKNDEVKVYFNDFARLVRQVREYDIRYSAPAFSSALVDISRVNPEYMVKKYSPTTFGAKIVAVNTSSGPILLGEESNMPLYIVGIQLEELSSGQVTMQDQYDLIDEKKLKVTQRERNLSIYGSQSFSIDSQYIQTMAQAKNMMKWVSKYCSRQRLKMSLEIFPNPLLELGDKVRIYDKTRGYTQENDNFGDRVFVVSSISHSVSESGPSMNIDIIEVGQ
jgi:hypothetical protein